MGGDARLIDVYEVVARDLDRALPGAPDVKAEVELTIGDTYRRLLRSVEAEPHLRKALARFREIGDRHELQAARAANTLALALADQGRADSVPVAEEALAVRERELAPDDPLLAESRRTLAQALLASPSSANAERARPLLEQALQGFRRSYGDEHADTAETKLCLARLEDTAPKEIEALLVQAIASFASVAPDDPRAIGCFETYASFLQSSGRFDEARTMLDRASTLAKKLFGDALATDLLRRSARLEYARGDMATSEMLSRRAVAHELRRWAERRPEESSSLRALAYRVEEPGSPSSEPPYARAFAELKRLEGEGSFELAQWMNGIALVLHELGRLTAIEPMLREALEIRCRALSADCPVRQTTIELLARELALEQRGAEMVPLLEESVATYARRGDSDSPGAARAGRLLAACRAQVKSKPTADDESDAAHASAVRESSTEDSGGGQGVSAPR
jgi:tetratricopeptide (TPR) repeat protein